jgi:hypothetical protein
MRLLPDGEILPKEKALNKKEASFCLGTCKHQKFTPYKAEEPCDPSITGYLLEYYIWKPTNK